MTGKNGVIAGGEKKRSAATSADGELELNSGRIMMTGADFLPSPRVPSSYERTEGFGLKQLDSHKSLATFIASLQPD